MKKKIMFISSSGGHLSELLELDKLMEDFNACLVTEKIASSEKLRSKYKKVYYLIYGTRFHLFSYIFKFTANVFISFFIYIINRPDVIVSVGSHACVPMFYLGKLFGSKLIFIETFANSNSKTLTGKLVYPITNVFYVQWEEMKDLYPKAIFEGRVY